MATSQLLEGNVVHVSRKYTRSFSLGAQRGPTGDELAKPVTETLSNRTTVTINPKMAHPTPTIPAFLGR